MKSNLFLQLIILICGLVLALPVHAQEIDEDTARAWTQEKGEILLSTFKDSNTERRYQVLDNLFLEHVDLSYISKFVIGRYWREMTPVQQKQYQNIFQRYALSLYKNFPLNFGGDIGYKVNKVTYDKAFTVVSAVVNVNLGGEMKNFPIEFRLHKNNGKIQIIDIKLAESSLILAYRNRFYEMISANDGDVVWFLEDLENITASSEQRNKTELESAQY